MSAFKDFKKKVFNPNISSQPWHVLDTHMHVEKDVSDSRYAICKTCPELIQATKQCKQCGCFMAIKTKLVNAKCPLNKW